MTNDAPRSNRVGLYVAVGLAVAVVGLVVLWGAAGSGLFSPPRPKVEVPGVGSVDLRDAQRAVQTLEAAKDVDATDPEALKAYLPAAIAGFQRTELSTTTGGAAGVEGSAAEGKYARGDARLELQVVDIGGAGALLGMAAHLKASKETSTGYERVGKVDGRMTQEKYDRSSRHGEYSVVVGKRFMIHAEGDGVSMDELKAAVAAVPAAQLEGLAKAG
jgi:hypothetical protein